MQRGAVRMAEIRVDGRKAAELEERQGAALVELALAVAQDDALDRLVRLAVGAGVGVVRGERRATRTAAVDDHAR